MSHFNSRPGSAHGRAKLDEADVVVIRKLRREEGFTLRFIAKSYGMHYTTISTICSGKNWRHVN